jgi:hypothetical protein
MEGIEEYIRQKKIEKEFNSKYGSQEPDTDKIYILDNQRWRIIMYNFADIQTIKLENLYGRETIKILRIR